MTNFPGLIQVPDDAWLERKKLERLEKMNSIKLSLKELKELDKERAEIKRGCFVSEKELFGVLKK